LFGIIIFKGLSRIEGVILLIVYGVYLKEIIKQEKKFKLNKNKHIVSRGIFRLICIILFCVIMVLVGSELIVANSLTLSSKLGIPTLLIGIFIVSIGTTLPELTINIESSLSRHEGIFVGDLIGSLITNTLLVLGITAIIRPIQAPLYLFLSSGLFMIIIAFIFLTLAESGRKMTVKEGITLIFLYIFFTIVELNIKSLIG
jgi:cation:H+ antiporter